MTSLLVNIEKKVVDMGFAMLKRKAHALFHEAVFLINIKNSAEYEKVLDLMDDLFEDYDYNKPLIDILAASIERWENKASEFKKFNLAIKSLDPGLFMA